ncbi:MAG: hypothetical protein EBT37_06720, partial [Betaproteobacteria bacterium]|nr:hypothetical protein [Betaproteobacteria bacterium]
QDEYIIGFQKSLAKGWTGGVKYTSRTINNGMDDWCDPPSVGTWMKANGYPNFDYHTMAGCQLINPGRDVTLMMDANNDGKLKAVTVPASATGIAQYTRKYDALELSLEKQFDGKWGGSASYTYSRSVGTAEGYVNSTINQEDAGVSQDFDFGKFSDGANGPLPNDRTHAIKVPSTTPGDAPLYTSASTYYYLNPQGVTVLGERGNDGRTPWTTQLDLQLAYTEKMGPNTMTFQVDVFNVFDAAQVTETSEINDYSRGTTTVGQPGRLSLNFGNPTSFQPARSVRLSMRYEF